MYGYIPLTEIELELVNHPYFQRLNNIKQLGVGHRVFPGAQHTRFSHSLGIMYLMDRMTNSPSLKDDPLISKNKQKLRIAALLHDIGHYPLSHLVETVMTQNGGCKHERLSDFVINNSSVRDILEKKSVDPREIGQIITGSSSEPLFNQLMSSDLDVDRLDYLLRDSFHTGVAYGRFDLNRLVHTIALDNQGQLCIDKSGMHAAEGYIVGRYLMWVVVYTHRVTNALELMIKRICQELLGSLLPSFREIKEMIKEQQYYFTGFDDNFLFRTISGKTAETNLTGELCRMYMTREVLTAAKEAQGMAENATKDSEKEYYSLIEYSEEAKLQELAKESEVSADWIYYYRATPSLPDLKPTIEDQEKGIKVEEREMTNALRIVGKDGVSEPLAAIDTSLVFYLKNKGLDIVRIYTKEEYKTKLKTVLEKKLSN